MAEIKAHEYDQFARRRARDYRIVLVYGPDRGLVSERATELAKATGVNLDDPFSFMRLDASDIISDPGRLFDEANSTGLFGGEKLIWIKGAGADKGFADAVTDLAKTPPDSAWVLIEAGDLKKGANLRKAAEQAPAAMAIPCYADEARTLNQLIDQELSESNLRISAAARSMLLSSLGGDRLASRSELRKLVLYAAGDQIIEEHHVTEIVGDASALSTDDTVDAVLLGDKVAFLQTIQRVTASKTPIFLVAQGCLKTLQLLDVMRGDMDSKRMSASDAMNQHGRHLHYKRKDSITAALRFWRTPMIVTEMNRIQQAILQSRQRFSLEDTIITNALLATTLISGRAKERS